MPHKLVASNDNGEVRYFARVEGGGFVEVVDDELSLGWVAIAAVAFIVMAISAVIIGIYFFA